MTIRTILVDDEPLATQGLQLRLQAHEDVEVVAALRDRGEDLPANAERRLLEVRFLGRSGEREREPASFLELHLPRPRSARLSYRVMPLM